MQIVCLNATELPYPLMNISVQHGQLPTVKSTPSSTQESEQTQTLPAQQPVKSSAPRTISAMLCYIECWKSNPDKLQCPELTGLALSVA